MILVRTFLWPVFFSLALSFSSVLVVAATPSLRDCNNGKNDIMVAVGSWCVDKYEASVWSEVDGQGKAYFTDSTTDSKEDHYYPTGNKNVPQGCQRDGKGCRQYAASKAGVIPARGVTWYQAARFCANAGKQLVPDSLWQVAAIGTHDPGESSGKGGTKGGSAADAAGARCNINSAHKGESSPWLNEKHGVRLTAHAGKSPGGDQSCISDFGVEDMVGNLWEWTDLNGLNAGVDLSQFNRGKSNEQGGPFDVADATWNLSGSAHGCQGSGFSKKNCQWSNNTPVAVLRGGCWGDGVKAGVTALGLRHSGAYSSWFVGFRCARPR